MIRINPITVISKVGYGDYNIHDIQSNTAWAANPYGDAYAIVPDEMVPGVMETHGFINPVFNEDGTELVSYTALDIPEIPKDEVPPSDGARISALEEENALLKAQIQAQSDQMDFYEECIVEMAEIVYA